MVNNEKQEKLRYGPVNYVDPNIGTLGHLLTSTKPILSLPHGMVQCYPALHKNVGGDRYVNECVHGFSVGTLVCMPAPAGCAQAEYASSIDHDFEETTPFSYKVLLEKDDMWTEFAVTRNCLLGKVQYINKNGAAFLLKGPSDMHASVKNENCITVTVGEEGRQEFFEFQFSSKICSTDFYESCQDIFDNGRCIKVYLEAEEGFEFWAGYSYIDQKFAEKHMKPCLSLDVEEAARRGRDVWNDILSRIEVRGGTQEQCTIFYTGLYRSVLKMRNITEFGKYRGYDGMVHETDGHDYYISDNMWDSFRCKHPLQLILEPHTQEDMVQSYVRMFEQSGWLPQFPEIWGDRGVMLGNHTAAMIWDTYNKGYQDFDVDTAYEAMKNNSLEHTKIPWAKGSKTQLDLCYEEKGFFPALKPGETETEKKVHPFERRQAVAVTLEHAYDDWCVAQLAKALGKNHDYEFFIKRSGNYKNVFNSKTGFMSPKAADGSWIEDFDPKYGGGLGGRDYFAECNSWIYSFFVPHDIEGLTKLMGGKKGLESRLDALFTEGFDGPKFRFLAQFPDATGLIGQYCQGNEPAFHIPYLYNFTDSPWKTQRVVRRIMEVWYSDSPLGICGDDDEGAMSSWYVFSAIGLYPVCVGKAFYALSSPVFEEVKLHLDNGKEFTICADGTSPQNKYIKSIRLNGEVVKTPFLSDAQLRGGGTLYLEMGNRPGL
ncbi:MAG: GH92 family glycosyl hydrolase [Eubacteriales bacterium]|nr:GH92 family glycosyl hydrolase [Eubacteriales bacterium]